MKTKILLTSALALAISVPAMAADPTQTTVTSSSSCTETTLGTATGPVDIEADWQANTIKLNWDANNGTVSGGPTQCTYDGTFTLPTSISRTGYEFAGWLVKNGPAQCSASVISSLNANVSTNATAYGYTKLDGTTGSKEAEYGLTPGSGEWGTTFSYGIIKGISRCSKVGSGYNYYDVATEEVTDNLNEDGAQYCWCQMTAYTPTGGEMCTAASRWVLYSNYGSASNCVSNCTRYCGRDVRNISSLRAGLFGSVAQ